MTNQIVTTRSASDQLSDSQERAIGALLATRTIKEAALAALRFLAKAQSTAKFVKKDEKLCVLSGTLRLCEKRGALYETR